MRVFSWFTLNERKEGQLPSGRLRTRVAEAVHPAAAAAAAAPSGSLEHRPPAALSESRPKDQFRFLGIDGRRVTCPTISNLEIGIRPRAEGSSAG